MSNNQRVSDLETYIQQWEDALKDITEIRDRLIGQQSVSFPKINTEAAEKLRQRILQTDAAVIEHHKLLIHMESLLGLAKSEYDG